MRCPKLLVLKVLRKVCHLPAWWVSGCNVNSWHGGTAEGTWMRMQLHDKWLFLELRGGRVIVPAEKFLLTIQICPGRWCQQSRAVVTDDPSSSYFFFFEFHWNKQASKQSNSELIASGTRVAGCLATSGTWDESLLKECCDSSLAVLRVPGCKFW